MKQIAKWHYYYQVTRRVQRIPAWIAHRLPAWLKYWVYIDVVSAATVRPPLDRKVTTDVTAMEILEVMHRGR